MALSASDRQRRYRQKKYARLMSMPPVPCGCGCGQPIPPINKKGRAAQYAHGHNPTPPPPRSTPASQAKAAESRRRPGSEWRVRGGYVRILLDPAEVERHPTALRHEPARSWSMPRSHYVWNDHHPEDPVMPGDHIHHRNHVRDDDWIDNLEKLPGSEHLRMHARQRRAKEVV